MKKLAFFLTATASLCIAGSALANGLGEDGAWQFQTAAQKEALNLNLQLMQSHNANPATGAAGTTGTGAGGLASALAVGTLNEFIDQSTTVNQCSAASGGTITCTATRGTNTSDATQTNSNSSSSASNTLTGNQIMPTNITNNPAH